MDAQKWVDVPVWVVPKSEIARLTTGQSVICSFIVFAIPNFEKN